MDMGADVWVATLDDPASTDIPGVEYEGHDLRHPSDCEFAVAGAGAVFHLAGIKASARASVEQPASHFVPSLQMNTNLLESARLEGVKRLVFTSSIGAYPSAEVFTEGTTGDPMDFAGWTKLMAEFQIGAYRKQYGTDWSIVRPSNVYGPGDNFGEGAMVIPSLMAKIASREPVVMWGTGYETRDFVFSRDVAEGIILAAVHGTHSGVASYCNLGSGRGVTILELLKTMQEVVNFDFKFDVTKPAGYPKRVMNQEYTKYKLGWEANTSLKDGLTETWEWFLDNRDEHLKRKNYFDNQRDETARSHDVRAHGV